MIEVGQQAPEFNLPDENGKEVSLSDFKGKKVVLMFYPKDNTPGCTKQACTIRDGYQELQNQNIEVLGINADSQELHSKFKQQHDLPHTLLSDPSLDVLKQYGAYGMKNMYGKQFEGIIRRSVLVDEQGEIQHIFKRPKTKEHASEILNKL